jgi:Mlc titration factor MtfA (ptsG expression regulator)
MFHWLSDHRRKKLAEAPFPAAWEEILRCDVIHYCMLDVTERTSLHALIQVFIAEKKWEGCGGLELTDEIRVTVCSREYLHLRLKHDAEAGRKSLLSAYAATNEAEFFAVATEQFFDQPLRMKKHAPDLYRVLNEYYRQDPAERVGKITC